MVRTAHPKNLLSRLAKETVGLCLGCWQRGEFQNGLDLKSIMIAKGARGFDGSKISSGFLSRYWSAFTGSLGIALGVIGILQNLEGSIGILLLATASIWIGFDGILMATVSGPIGSELKVKRMRRVTFTNSNDINQVPSLHPADEASFGSIVDLLREMTHRGTVQAAAILWPKQSGWTFKAGSKCSATVGASIANQISQHKFPLDRQFLCHIRMLDRSVEALITPGPFKSGGYFLLVTIYAVESPSKEHEWLIARHAVLDVSFHLSIIQRVVPNHPEFIKSSVKRLSSKEAYRVDSGRQGECGKLLTCCSICEDVYASFCGNNQNWQPWTQWLNDALGISISHTICNRCAEAYYQSE